MSLATLQTVSETVPSLKPAAAAQGAPVRAPSPVLTLVPTERSPDTGLVAQALHGEAPGARAEEALYRKYRGAVSRIAGSFSELDGDEAEDVVQETFVRAFRALGTLKDPERFAAWLFTIARNRARSYLTSRGTHQKASEDATREQQLAGDVAPAASDQLEHEAALKTVREVIEALKEGAEKETVRLFYLEGKLSAREIAERMGVGKSAVTMRLERFRAKVRRQILRRCAG